MKIDKLIESINKSATISIISHISPDGDTVGSALALYNALKMYGKKPYIFCEDAVSDKLCVIGNTAAYNTEYLDSYDLAVSVDTASFERMGKAADEFVKAKRTANIDHHVGNTRYADVNVIAEAAATAEIMYRVISEFINVDKNIARCLYSGLITDTGCFAYSSVTENTLKIASELISLVDYPHLLVEDLMRKIPMNVFKLRNRALQSTKFYCNERIAVVTVTNKDFIETGTTSADTDGIVNMPRNIDSVLISVIISEHKDNAYKLSFRTGDEVNANYIAMRFGGGGHKNASGCRLSGSLEEVLEKVLKACSDELPF